MSNWFQENIAKLTTAWQAALLFTLLIFQQMYAILGISIVDKPGAIILVLGGLTLTAYLYTVTKVYGHKDSIVDVTPKEQFTIKQALSLIQEVFGLKPQSKFVPNTADPVPSEVDHVSREEFDKLGTIMKKTLELLEIGGTA